MIQVAGHRRWWPLLPGLLVLAVWAPSLGAVFQFDDFAVIVDEPRVHSISAWWQSMPGIRPLLKLSYAMNHALDARPWGFRLVNVLLHALNATLVFAIVRRLARRLRVADESGALLLAAVTTLVFALHPAQTESVTYVSGRSNVLMASGVLAGLYLWLRDADVPLWRRQLTLLAALACAAATKETALVAPLALGLVVFLERGRGIADVLRAAWPSLLLSLLLAGCALLALPYASLLAFSLTIRDPLSNLLTQARGIGWLVAQVFRPDLLSADPALSPVTQWDPVVGLTGLALVAMLALGIASLRRRPGLAFGLLWCAVWLLPTNSFIARLDVANDRQLYLPLLGVGWLLGLALLRLPPRLNVTLPVVGVLAVALLAGTALRNEVYRTETAFWQDALAKAPWNARAANNLGMAHAKACEPIAAEVAFRHAIGLAPQDVMPRINLALLQRGELKRQPGGARCQP
ncbi:MAG: hypothetical protein RLZZ200_663 [Pseudomonadota bacterium]|jgi:hypothetical protein